MGRFRIRDAKGGGGGNRNENGGIQTTVGDGHSLRLLFLHKEVTGEGSSLTEGKSQTPALES